MSCSKNNNFGQDIILIMEHKNIHFEMYRLDTDEIETNLTNSFDENSNIQVSDELNTLLYTNITQEFWYELKQEINAFLL